MEIKVETALPSDLDELYRIEVNCFEKEAFSKRQIAYLLKDYNSIAFTAKIQGRMVGFIIAAVYFERKAIFGHILTIDVAPQNRGKGVASVLMDAVEEIFRQRGATASHLEVREDNAAAISLYEKMGYEKIGTLRRYYGNENGLYLAKKL